MCLALLVLPPSAYGAGELDSSFGGDGQVTTNFTRRADDAVGVAIQSDQRIITVGGVNLGADGRFGLARYDTNGALDRSFGGDGKVTTNFSPGYDAALDVALQADGKIVAAGYASGAGGRIALARYNADGSIDKSFGGDGRVTTNVSAGFEVGYGVVVQVDQRIVVAGRIGGFGGRLAVARYYADGSLDDTFSRNGIARIDFTRGDDRADHVAVQADGKLVAAGTANYFRRSARFAVVRLDTNGRLDSSFGSDGKVTTNFTDSFDGAFAVAIQEGDQKIVAAGQAGSAMGIARYDIDGALDSTFGASGMATTNFTSGLDYADDVAIEPSGKIVALGSANFFGDDSRFALTRYTTNGDLDAIFHDDGKVTTNFTQGRDQAYGLALQADGNIVAAGLSGGKNSRFALARYLGA